MTERPAGGRTFAVILVPSTSHAMHAENILIEAGIPCKLIPVPRELSSDCGVCLRIDPDDQEAALRELQRRGVAIEGVHGLW